MPLAAPGQRPPPPLPPPPPTDQTPASPQTPVPAREAPGAIYKDAMHPLDVVRASLGNWSEAELAALAVGMQRAREACDASSLYLYPGQTSAETSSGFYVQQSGISVQRDTRNDSVPDNPNKMRFAYRSRQDGVSDPL